MLKILQATCRNGKLILNEKLSPELEGKSLKIIIVDLNEPNQDILDNGSKLEQL